VVCTSTLSVRAVTSSTTADIFLTVTEFGGWLSDATTRIG
jgi:hypothetical protein